MTEKQEQEEGENIESITYGFVVGNNRVPAVALPTDQNNVLAVTGLFSQDL